MFDHGWKRELLTIPNMLSLFRLLLIPVYIHMYLKADDSLDYYLAGTVLGISCLTDLIDGKIAREFNMISNTGKVLDPLADKLLVTAAILIFIQNGYSKYCLDMEVNDISVLEYPCPKYIEKARKELTKQLSEEGKKILTSIFIENRESLEKAVKEDGGRKRRILVLTEPLCDLETRKRIFEDIIEEYQQVEGEQATVLLKPHPRDVLDYQKIFPEHIVLDGKFPMEILNYVDGLVFDKVISVFTVPSAIQFAKEKVFLGEDFMDKYEEPEIHRQNEQIY